MNREFGSSIEIILFKFYTTDYINAWKAEGSQEKVTPNNLRKLIDKTSNWELTFFYSFV